MARKERPAVARSRAIVAEAVCFTVLLELGRGVRIVSDGYATLAEAAAAARRTEAVHADARHGRDALVIATTADGRVAMVPRDAWA